MKSRLKIILKYSLQSNNRIQIGFAAKPFDRHLYTTRRTQTEQLPFIILMDFRLFD